MVPVSTATNSYELLDEVIQIITDEPNRLWMDNWIATIEGRMPGRPDATRDWTLQLHNVHLPACGTIACVAGWVVLIRLEHPSVFFESANARCMISVMAYESFPVELRAQLEALFLRKSYAMPGSTEYVQNVVRDIQQLQRRYADVLKNFPLVPPTRRI